MADPHLALAFFDSSRVSSAVVAQTWDSMWIVCRVLTFNEFYGKEYNDPRTLGRLLLRRETAEPRR
jgi:hypothetical protein